MEYVFISIFIYFFKIFIVIINKIFLKKPGLFKFISFVKINEPTEKVNYERIAYFDDYFFKQCVKEREKKNILNSISEISSLKSFVKNEIIQTSSNMIYNNSSSLERFTVGDKMNNV